MFMASIRKQVIHSAAALTVLLALFANNPSQAQGSAIPAADEQALRTLVLREDTVKRVLAVAEEGQRAQIKTSPGTSNTIDGLAKQIESNPQAAALLAKHKLSSREYVMTTVALLRAGFAAEANAKDLNQAGTNASNVAFAKANKARIQAAFSGLAGK